LNDHKWEGIDLMEELYSIHQTLPQQLVYPVLITPAYNEYQFSVPDFPEICFMVPSLEEGINTVTQSLKDVIRAMQFPPAATPLNTIPLSPGQFIVQIQYIFNA